MWCQLSRLMVVWLVSAASAVAVAATAGSRRTSSNGRTASTDQRTPARKAGREGQVRPRGPAREQGAAAGLRPGRRRPTTRAQRKALLALARAPSTKRALAARGSITLGTWRKPHVLDGVLTSIVSTVRLTPRGLEITRHHEIEIGFLVPNTHPSTEIVTTIAAFEKAWGDRPLTLGDDARPVTIGEISRHLRER